MTLAVGIMRIRQMVQAAEVVRIRGVLVSRGTSVWKLELLTQDKKHDRIVSNKGLWTLGRKVQGIRRMLNLDQD